MEKVETYFAIIAVGVELQFRVHIVQQMAAL